MPHRNALVCSHDHLTLFLTLVSGLEFIRFDLDLVRPRGSPGFWAEEWAGGHVVSIFRPLWGVSMLTRPEPHLVYVGDGGVRVWVEGE